jgi:hypothetical protein
MKRLRKKYLRALSDKIEDLIISEERNVSSFIDGIFFSLATNLGDMGFDCFERAVAKWDILEYLAVCNHIFISPKSLCAICYQFIDQLKKGVLPGLEWVEIAF